MRRLVLIFVAVLAIAGCVEKTESIVSAPQYAMTSAKYLEFRMANYDKFYLLPRQIDGDKATNNIRDIVYDYTGNWLSTKMLGKGKEQTFAKGERVLEMRYALVSDQELSDENLVKLVGITPGLAAGDQSKLSFGVSLFDNDELLWRGIVQGVPQERGREEGQQRFEMMLEQLLAETLELN